nr:Tex-like N-terminal domain-containing protein [Pseudomonas citronellolis]
MDSINTRIAEELSALPSGRVQPQQVAAAVALLDEGSTVPFIARYRKEVTGSLDDTQLRLLEERLRYLRELDERRASILASIEEQGKLTPELAREIKLADTKTRLEDLYLPYKQKRRTKGQIALEAGLGELADALFADPTLTPETEAARFVDAEKGFADTKAVLEGAKYILMERFAEDATLLDRLRVFLKDNATLTARLVPGKETEGAKFSDYFEHDEPFKGAPSHRALAIFRGRNEGVLSVALKVGEELPGTSHPCEAMIAERFGISNQGRAADKWAGRGGALDLEGQALHPPGDRPARRAARRRRRRGDQRLRPQPARPAAGRPGRPARHPGPGPGPAHRRQGGRGRRHRQAAGHRHRLPPTRRRTSGTRPSPCSPRCAPSTRWN